jgi:signal transduction histidine kinase/ligand-binding sensor domain-containing protein
MAFEPVRNHRNHRNHRGSLPPWVLWLGLTVLGAAAVQAVQIPNRFYGTEDGLASDTVMEIFQDSRGYLWFGTSEGVSRFDGERFVNYGEEHGLPHPRVQAILEDREGRYWFGTDGGLGRWVPARTPGRLEIERVPFPGWEREHPFSPYVSALYQDRAGRLWIANWNRILVYEAGRFRPVPLDFQDPPLGQIQAFAETRDGSLWTAADTGGLLRRLPGGRTVRYRLDGIKGAGSLLADRHGVLWVGGSNGLILLRPSPPEAVTGEEEKDIRVTGRLEERLELPRRPGEALALAGAASPLIGPRWLSSGPDGRIWVSTPQGVIIWDGKRLTNWGQDQGIPVAYPMSLAQDRDGNLWLGMESRGAVRVARDGFMSYGTADGLVNPRIASLFEVDGELYAQTVGTADLGVYLHRLRGGRFSVVPLNLGDIEYPGWGWNHLSLRARDGTWWVPTGSGLLRFPAGTRYEDLGSARPVIYTTRDGLGGREGFRLYEDGRGDLWYATFGPETVTRWRRTDQRFVRYALRSSGKLDTPTAFAEDRAGNLWLGFYRGGLQRLRPGSKGFESFGREAGVPPGLVHDLHLDRSGRLWVATAEGGAARMDRPDADRPRLVRYTRREGLATNSIRCVTDDGQGRIYLGGTRGLDRLDPATGRIQHFTTADGLASNLVHLALRDHRGTLWFGTLGGLSRLEPRPEAARRAPFAWISSVRINGTPSPVSELGVSRVTGLAVPPGPSHIEIGYLALSLAPGERLRYQHRLVGVEEGWSPPADERSVVYARLPAGRFRFLVRAVTVDGTVSPRPAELSFTVHPPLWRRWWFLTGAALLLAAGASALYRWRVGQLLAVERMRTGITRDLHDDLGSSLSRISILSEVAQRRVEEEPAAARSLMESIGGTSRELMEALAESIWAIDPKRDDLKSFVTRVRRFAADLLEGRGIAWELRAPAEADLKLSPEQRRQLYLIVKEALHNVIKHAGASSVQLSIVLSGRRLVVEVKDDGAGFDLPQTGGDARDGDLGGHGLASLRSRAEALGGRLTLDTAPGRGTTVRAEVPLHHA